MKALNPINHLALKPNILIALITNHIAQSPTNTYYIIHNIITW